MAIARFVLRDSIPIKILLITACALAFVYVQPPVATAQRVGGGGHPAGGARVAAPPRVAVPPAPRTTPRAAFSHPRGIAGPRLTAPGARFGLRPGTNNLFFRRRFFFGAFGSPFFRFGPAFAFNSFGWQNCNPYWVWGSYCNGLSLYGYGFGNGFENYVTYQPYEPPAYLYASDELSLVWLYMKDGTAYSVRDYWFVDGQVHFIAVEQGGAKSVEQTIPLRDLDAQKTVDVNSRRGFLVVMRDEPLEQYLRDHPALTPPLLVPF
jgi:hypothetical protein